MLVAVYGTLKKNFSNHQNYLGRSFLVQHITVPALMFSLKHFPGVVLHEDIPVTSPAKAYTVDKKTHAEVYSIDEHTRNRLDGLEGHPSFYMRKTITDNLLGDIYIYTIKPHVYLKGIQEVIPSGIWIGSSTTVQQVDFHDGNLKPRLLGWKGPEKKTTQIQVPTVYDKEKHNPIFDPTWDAYDDKASEDDEDDDSPVPIDISIDTPYAKEA